MNKMKMTGAAALAVLALTGCGVSTAADEVAVQIGGGIAEDSELKGCKEQGAREVWPEWGDDFFKVPAGVRNYRARANENTEREQGAMTFTVKGVKLRSDVTVDYAVNTDCTAKGDALSPLETFVRDFGIKYERTHGDNWFVEVLRDYVGIQSDQALDDAAAELVQANPDLTWRSFLSDTATKTAFEERAGVVAQRLIEEKMGGQRFCGPGSTTDECQALTFTISPPEPTDKALVQLIRDEEVAAGQVGIAREQKLANDAKLDADAALRAAYGVDGVIEQRRLDIIEKAVEDGKVTLLPLPSGSDVAVTAPPAG